MTNAITVESVSKRYVLGKGGRPGGSLRDSIADAWTSFRDRFRNGASEDPAQEFWALRDLSFAVRPGEVVGLIGRNGAGKSTLLKILSRITHPTSGSVRMRGRTASLLEVGTGFHPELTGYENIFLNGAILGMSRSEIRSKLDAIIAFAEIEKFIHTPVKRYSSGMYVRLAFAVAAHLEPDILLVDEVLAVGDAAFQRKCLAKMDEAAKQARTVLFVSHNLSAVRQLCSRGIVIERGNVEIDAPADEAIRHYTREVWRRQKLSDENLKDRLNRTSGKVRFVEARLVGSDGEDRWSFQEGDAATLQLTIESSIDLERLGVYIALNNAETNEPVTSIKELAPCRVAAGSRAVIRVTMPSLPLRSGDFSLYVCIGDDGFEKFHDVLDRNVSLPMLSVSAIADDPHRNIGVFSIPYSVSIADA